MACDNKECFIKIIGWCYNKKNNTCINSFIQNKKCGKKNNTNNIYIYIYTLINLFKTKSAIRILSKIFLYMFKHLLWLVGSKIFCTNLIIYLKQKGNICSHHVTFIEWFFVWWYHLFLCVKIIAVFLST